MASAEGDCLASVGRNLRSSDASIYDENAEVEKTQRTPIDINNKTIAACFFQNDRKQAKIDIHKKTERGVVSCSNILDINWFSNAYRLKLMNC